MTNKEIKELMRTIESTLVSKQNQIQRDKFNINLKNQKIETLEIQVQTRNERISELLGYVSELENKLIEEAKKSIK